MLLTVTTTHEPATDLGHLLHKHPARVQAFPRRPDVGEAAVVLPVRRDDGGDRRGRPAGVLPVGLGALQEGGGAVRATPVPEPERVDDTMRHQRSLALREYGLGLEALDRVAAGEPLWRVHECVFAVLALESEPVDPRL